MFFEENWGEWGPPTFFLFPTKYEKSWIFRVGGAFSPHIKKDENLREMISLVLNWFGH